MTNLMIRKLEEIEIVPTDKVIRSADYQVTVETGKALDAIEEEAKRLYEQVREQAQAKGEEQAQQIQNKQLLDTTAGIIKHLETVEQKLVDVVTETVKKMVGDTENIQLVSGMIQKALQHVRNEEHITLRVSPDQVKEIQEQLKEITKNYTNIGQIEVVATPKLAAGTCRLETNVGTVETRLEGQIATVKKAFEEAFSAPGKQ
ncbi:MAG: type III secretion system stator protein SctL [Gammaproteobacteria bacterium]